MIVFFDLQTQKGSIFYVVFLLSYEIFWILLIKFGFFQFLKLFSYYLFLKLLELLLSLLP